MKTFNLCFKEAIKYYKMLINVIKLKEHKQLKKNNNMILYKSIFIICSYLFKISHNYLSHTENIFLEVMKKNLNNKADMK